ncbi:MAG: prenyltransferase [Deltaproteobacteria bacterium]|nr:prenyltransferase [Deltaproteobacteria bacterium]
MKTAIKPRWRLLSALEINRTTHWLLSQQKITGEIPWIKGGKSDPWDHIHAAMGLTTMGHLSAAKAAFRYLATTQQSNGSWPAERTNGKVSNATQESNHAAYLATGLWHLHYAQSNPDFLDEMWPTLEAAIDLVVSMQEPSGAISWAISPEGKIWRAPLLAGSSSIHGSLVCAIRIAERLGHDRPLWRRALRRLARVLRYDIERFSHTDLPEKPGRFSMDWYYPVLGGAVRGEAGRQRLLDPSWHDCFVEEGVGCRCVKDHPWYTVAETCELVLTLNASGLIDRAREVLSWMDTQRTAEGTYWTGMTHPDKIIYPDGEQTTWTAASVLIATDAVRGHSETSEFFLELAGDDLTESDVVVDLPEQPKQPRSEEQGGYSVLDPSS